MGRVLEGARLAGYGAAYFFASGAFMSYWPVWLHDRGITDAEIGTLFMTRQLASVVAVLGIGFLAHRLGGLRGLLLGLAAAAIVMMGAYQLSYTFLALFVVGLAWGCIWSPTMALYDGVLVNEAKARGFIYGRLRVWSSVAFIAGTLICGVAVDRYGPPSVLFVGWAGIFCLLPLALGLAGWIHGLVAALGHGDEIGAEEDALDLGDGEQAGRQRRAGTSLGIGEIDGALGHDRAAGNEFQRRRIGRGFGLDEHGPYIAIGARLYQRERRKNKRRLTPSSGLRPSPR